MLCPRLNDVAPDTWSVADARNGNVFAPEPGPLSVNDINSWAGNDCTEYATPNTNAVVNGLTN
ncbi:hypothetical protein, partial [Klebsiella quasipneumoniae]|uniref:hypothetical protein n=1 Tax=Klebsiella quasipneumoniae TaxID=1463165 RepID=UPI002730E6B3